MFYLASNQENANENDTIPCLPIRLRKTKMIYNNHCWQGCGEISAHKPLEGWGNWLNFRRVVLQYYIILSNHIPYNLVIPFLGTTTGMIAQALINIQGFL